MPVIVLACVAGVVAVALVVALVRFGLGLLKLLLVLALLVIAYLGTYAALRHYGTLERHQALVGEERIAARVEDPTAARVLEAAFAPCIGGELWLRAAGRRGGEAVEQRRESVEERREAVEERREERRDDRR